MTMSAQTAQSTHFLRQRLFKATLGCHLSASQPVALLGTFTGGL